MNTSWPIVQFDSPLDTQLLVSGGQLLVGKSGKGDLLSFLISLPDYAVLNDPRFSNLQDDPQ